MMEFIHAHSISILQGTVMIVLAILFLQSGFDKVFHYKANLDWLKGHFESSPLAGMVSFMLIVVTFMELAAGLTSIAGLFGIAFSGSNAVAALSVYISTATLILLFFGQRMAKDYEGAAVLVKYLLLCITGQYIMTI